MLFRLIQISPFFGLILNFKAQYTSIVKTSKLLLNLILICCKFQFQNRDMVTNTNQMENNASHRPGQVNSSLDNIVPACPPGLCINKGDFLKQDFSVDNFFIKVGVREWGAGLDVLRDDLGIYLKVLCFSMIELINQDYGDFVNLSTNLVGLDQGIDRIREPLEGFKKEIVYSIIMFYFLGCSISSKCCQD